jgi:hypothetical protein
MHSRSSGSHQHEWSSGVRYEPTVVYMMAQWMRARGVNLNNVPGPWQATQRPLRRAGLVPPVDDGAPGQPIGP